MSKFARCLNLLTVVFILASAQISFQNHVQAASLYEQPFRTNGIFFSNLGGQTGADQFILSSDSIVTTVKWWGIYNAVDLPAGVTSVQFSINFYAADGDLPTLDPSFTKVVSAQVKDTGVKISGANFHDGRTIYEFSAQLTDTFSVSAGITTWISIFETDSSTPPVGGTQWLWSMSPFGQTDTKSFRNTSPEFASDWELSAQSGQLAFALQGIANTTQPRYSVIDLGDLGGVRESKAKGINDVGQVVGISSSDDRGLSAFLWDSENGIQNIGYHSGIRVFSEAYGINNIGQVVGSYKVVGNGSTSAFLWDSTNGLQGPAYLPGGDNSVAYRINNNGQVVGTGTTSTGWSAFSWDITNGMQVLGHLSGGGDLSVALGVNDQGQVVGHSDTSPGRGAFFGGPETGAFLWDSVNGIQGPAYLPGGGNFSEVHSINNKGQVVGVSDTSSGKGAFLWDSVNGMQELGYLPGGGERSIAFDINEQGQVVGDSDSSIWGGAFLWDQDNGMVHLETLIHPDDPLVGIILFQAVGINASGQIIANGDDLNGESRAFLLTPIQSQ